MENLRPLRKFTGKIDPRTDHTCICAGVVGLESQAKRCISSCIFLQMLALTPPVAPYYFCTFAANELYFSQIRQ